MERTLFILLNSELPLPIQEASADLRFDMRRAAPNHQVVQEIALAAKCLCLYRQEFGENDVYIVLQLDNLLSLRSNMCGKR